jgi:hypothetical protein
MAGDGSWKLPETVDCEFPGACITPPLEEECVILYEYCNYEG